MFLSSCYSFQKHLCSISCHLILFSCYIQIWTSCIFSTSILQIQHPRSNLNGFDMVITPRHEYYPLTPGTGAGSSVYPEVDNPTWTSWWACFSQTHTLIIYLLLPKVVITYTLLSDSRFWLWEFCIKLISLHFGVAASTWHDEFAPLPKPLLVVNIGGPTHNYSFLFESVILYT